MSHTIKLGRIGKRGRRNPAQRIRSTRRKPGSQEKPWRFSGAYRSSENRYPREMTGTLGYYHVQVRRAKRWITLATFPRDELTGQLGKARATEYGKLLARRYPRQHFRVFWPDALRKNPLENGGFYVEKYGGGRYTSVAFFGTRAEAEKEVQKIKQAGAWSGMPPRVTPARKKNPAPRVRADGAEVERAARLFTAFTGHRVTKMRQVSLPPVKVGLAVGPVLEIAYETTRDGKRENYLHKFRRGARPLLAASQDGRTLLLLSGAYRFTSRGIVDTPQ